MESLYGTSFSDSSMKVYVSFVTKTLRRFPRSVGLVFRGVSGMVVGIRAADKTKRHYAIVRKSKNNNHSSRLVEGFRPKKYIIVDDFICSGATVRAIVKAMDNETCGKCVGVILYNGTLPVPKKQIGKYTVPVFGRRS